MTYPTTFNNVTTNQPGSVLDTMFSIAGQQGNIPCTATGTNTISLTEGTNYYRPTAYTLGQQVSFAAAATSTGAVTMRAFGLAFLKVFMPSGIQAASGDIVINTNYLMQFFPNLDGGAGGWQIVNGTTATAVASPLGSAFKNLKLVTASDTTVTPTADEIIVENSAGGTVRLRNLAPAVTSTASVGTANGIVSAVAANTWYSFWFIYNPSLGISVTNPGGWLDIQATTPTPPAGYTYWMRAGWFLTNGAAALNRTIQYGRKAQYIASGAGATTPQLPEIRNAAIGTVSTTAPVWQAIVVQNSGAAPFVNANAVNNRQFVPPTASEISLVVAFTSYKGGAGAGTVQIAPNANYGGYQNANGIVPPCDNGGSLINSSFCFDMVLEATTIQATMTGTAQAILCKGWTDNI